MRITPGSTGVWMQVVVFDAADEPAEIDLTEIIAAYIEQRQNGSLAGDTETLTLTKVADYSTHAAGNYVYEGDGEHYVAVPDSVVDAADLDVSVAVDSSTQTALGTSYRIEAAGGLTASDVRTALGLASANLDTQLAGIAVDADRIPAVPATESTAAAAQVAAEKVAAAYDADGTLTAEAIDEIALANKALLDAAHGGGSWEGGAGAGGGGLSPFTVTVESNAGDPIVGAIVYLLDATGDPINLWLPTNGDGEAQFHLHAGNYQYAVGSLVGYASPAAATKEILDATAATATVVLTRQTIDPPSDAILCAIEDYVFDGSKVAVEGATVTAIPNTLARLSGAGVLTTERTRATTDANGFFRLELVRADAMADGANYTIEIKHNAKKIYRQIKGPVPIAATATLNDIEAGA